MYGSFAFTHETTIYSITYLAQKAAEYAVSLGKGEAVQTDVTINDGKYEVPYVALTPISVYKDNMNEVIINSGFHLKEDVYLNMPEAGTEEMEQ